MVKNHMPMQEMEIQETWVPSLVRKTPCSRKWQSTPVSLPGKFHGQRNLAGYRPWGHKVSGKTDQLSTIFK